MKGDYNGAEIDTHADAECARNGWLLVDRTGECVNGKGIHDDLQG
jgi:hypothetical protein